MMISNLMNEVHDTPILNTHKYVVGFDGGEEAEFTTNAIYVSIYSQCDPEGNTYICF